MRKFLVCISMFILFTMLVIFTGCSNDVVGLSPEPDPTLAVTVFVNPTASPQEIAEQKEKAILSKWEDIVDLNDIFYQYNKDCSAISNVLGSFESYAWQIGPLQALEKDYSLEELELYERHLQQIISDSKRIEKDLLVKLSKHLDKRKISNTLPLMPDNSTINISDPSLKENVLIVSYLGYTKIPRGSDRLGFERSYMDWWEYQSGTTTLPVDYDLRKIPKYHMVLYLGSKYADSFRDKMQ